MEYYDVIIIGAGIAGCGLAYNLKRIGYEGKVLILDKKGIGANAAYGYRNTFGEIIEEYKLPYLKKYNKLKIGDIQGVKLEANMDFYLVNYPQICSLLLKRSKIQMRKEEVIHSSTNTLATNKLIYKFKYLIDASGSSFFLRRLFNLKLPFKYYIGNLKNYKLKKKSDSNTFTYYSDKRGYVEDIYFYNDNLIQGDWQIMNKIDFAKIRSPNYNIFNNLKEKAKKINQSQVIAPVSPVFPLAKKNYAFLGDSFGNATPSLGEGIRPILNTSKILAVSILKNNLKSYEKEWKKRYLNQYIKAMAPRMNLKNRFVLLKIIKNNPNFLQKIIKGESPSLPKKYLKKISLKVLFEWIFYYLYLRLIYATK